MFSWEHCELLKESCFEEHLGTSASVVQVIHKLNFLYKLIWRTFRLLLLKKNPSEFLVEQRAKSNERQAKSNEQRAKSFTSCFN